MSGAQPSGCSSVINEAGAEIYWRRILDRYCCSLKAALLITIISAIVMVRVSYMTSAPDYSKIKNMSFGTITDEHRSESAASWDWREVVASGFVLAVILAGYLYFRG